MNIYDYRWFAQSFYMLMITFKINFNAKSERDDQVTLSDLLRLKASEQINFIFICIVTEIWYTYIHILHFIEDAAYFWCDEGVQRLQILKQIKKMCVFGK